MIYEVKTKQLYEAEVCDLHTRVCESLNARLRAPQKFLLSKLHRAVEAAILVGDTHAIVTNLPDWRKTYAFILQR
jgi:hypothetical protein